MDGNGFKMRARSVADAKLMAAEMDLDAQRVRRRWSGRPGPRQLAGFGGLVTAVLIAAAAAG